jgi:hypothetical protein
MDGIPAVAEDLRDLLQAFTDHEVRFLIVGGYALAVHGYPRATGDLEYMRLRASSQGSLHSAAGALR